MAGNGAGKGNSGRGNKLAMQLAYILVYISRLSPKLAILVSISAKGIRCGATIEGEFSVYV